MGSVAARVLAGLLAGSLAASCVGPPTVRPAIVASPDPPAAAPIPTPVPSTSAAPITPSLVLGRAIGAGTLAFRSGDKLWSFDAETGAVAGLGEAHGVTRPAPDGHGYYVQQTSQPGSPGGSAYYDARTGVSRELRVPGFPWLEGMELAPDGKSVAYVADRRRLFLSLDGGPLLQVGDGSELIEPRWSPDGARLFAQKCHGCGALGAVMTLVLWERETGQLVDFYGPPPPRRVTPIDQPMAALFSQSFRIHSWSPDGRYVVGWVFDAVGSGEDLRKDGQEGRQLLVFDVPARRGFDLGRVSYEPSWVAWGPPHRLAFVGGPGWESWSDKSLRVWTPEGGFEHLLAPGEITYAPTWSDGGDLFFVHGTRRGGPMHSPAAWAAGVAPDSAGIGVRRSGGKVVSFVLEGAPVPFALRASRDGNGLLALTTTGAVQEIYYGDLRRGTSTPLIRLDPLQTGARPILTNVAWSR